MTTEASYFENHTRKDRFPWSLYHQPLVHSLERAIAPYRGGRVLVVGCGLEPTLEGMPTEMFWACDLDARAIAECKVCFPAMKDRLAVCPSPQALPSEGTFAEDFDVVVAKEVVEHLEDPSRWARMLAARVKPGGSLLLTTPNYGIDSTLGILESTVLELIAWKDGYSRKHIHPSKFSRRTLSQLDVGPGMELVSIEIPWTRWTLLGHWRRAA